MRETLKARALALLLVGVGLACRPAAEAPKPSVGEIVAGALPSVVLLVRTGPDGTQGYGAGFVVGEDGLVLTNLHVVEGAARLSAMLHYGDRLSYTPMDGGLGRFLFENDRDLVPAHLVRSDASVDLAVVRVDADTRDRVRLGFSERPVRTGDTVLALGHPGETVWSFTSGVVSAIHHGTIQHDAAVNQGSSGGPLLNEAGEVVGVNTSKLLQGMEGVGFARPVNLAGRVLENARAAPLIDFSSPEVSAVGCIRAQELADPAILECFDWEVRWRIFQEAVAGIPAALALSEADAAKLRALAGEDRKADWIARQRQGTLAWFQGRPKQEAPRKPSPRTPLLTEVDRGRLLALDAKLGAALEAESEAHKRRVQENNQVHTFLDDPAKVQGLLKMGIRADATHAVAPDKVWVRITGRNLDRSRYGFSELWTRAGDHWRQAWPAPPSLEGTLPEGWPPPLDDHRGLLLRYRRLVVGGLVGRLEGECPEGVECDQVLAPPGEGAQQPG